MGMPTAACVKSSGITRLVFGDVFQSNSHIEWRSKVTTTAPWNGPVESTAVIAVCLSLLTSATTTTWSFGRGRAIMSIPFTLSPVSISRIVFCTLSYLTTAIIVYGQVEPTGTSQTHLFWSIYWFYSSFCISYQPTKHRKARWHSDFCNGLESWDKKIRIALLHNKKTTSLSRP